MDSLTTDDLDLICEALEAWVKSHQTGALMGDLIGAMFVGKEGRAAYEADMVKRRAKEEADSRLRRQRSILLQAKLIGMRDRVVAEMLTR